MLLGKRPPSPLPMRRTASMKDVSAEDGPLPSDQEIPATLDVNRRDQRRRLAEDLTGDLLAASENLSPFLRDCVLCKSLLLPSRDIFMYRGEAFCSLKCREQQINHDMRKQKLKLLFLFSMKKKVSAQANSQASKASDKGEETMAAA